uniref:Inosine/uridine-preferring nucleoside hydrolase domain-containing protein n=1 Tax=Trichogramma kaykai TaxID=54128 RepID=A0ABD2XFJ5_9HYME
MGFLEKRKIKLIIDTDAGGDDAVAIMMALKAHKQVEVLAITCTYGNTYVENVAKNVLKILAEAERTDVSIRRFE